MEENKINMNVMQYSLQYWEDVKNNISEHNFHNAEVEIIGATLTDHDILCRLFKYAIIEEGEESTDTILRAYTNNEDVTLKIRECLVDTHTLEVVKDNRE